MLRALRSKYDVDARQIFVVSPIPRRCLWIEKLLREFPGVRGGTVHTAQARSPTWSCSSSAGTRPSRREAVGRAASQPVNVAVSRARRRLYVIGDHTAWSIYRHFDTLSGYLTPGLIGDQARESVRLGRAGTVRNLKTHALALPEPSSAVRAAFLWISYGQVPSLTSASEHLAHRFWIAAHDRGGGLDVAGGIKVLPGEREPGVTGELPEEGPLRPPVALAERMQGVDLAQVIGQPPDEYVAAQAAQAVLVVQLTKMTAATNRCTAAGRT